MKVIQFIGSIDKNAGGTAIYIQLLASELIKYASLVVVTAKTPNPLELKGVKVYALNFRLSRLWSLKKDFANILINEKPDVVHINGIWDPQNWLFQQVCIKYKVKVLLSPHGMLEPYILKRNSLKKKLALALYQKKAILAADYLHATALAELKQIRKLGFSSPARIIPNGIDIGDVISINKIGSSKTKINFLFLSRIHPKKGIEILIEAISCLTDSNLKITIAGEGEDIYIEQLKDLCIKKEVNHIFDFVGGVYGEQKWKLYSEADFFVLPTYSENFGIVIIEALAAGVPVITTQGTPWEELVANNCGWWIELSVPKLRETIKEALALSKKERMEMSESGKRLVKRKYQIQAVAQSTFEFYRNIMKGQVVMCSY